MHSKTSIDRLGARLKSGPLAEQDLRLLDDYRRTFAAAVDCVIGEIRQTLPVEPTARPAKSTLSIVQKLRRESIRLSQMQDIAGCRLVLSNIRTQDATVETLQTRFPSAQLIDRRNSPTHGYRAIHLVVNVDGKQVEVQLRTDLQHLWAQLSEDYADVVGAELKYGGGDEIAREMLNTFSFLIKSTEDLEEIFLDEEDMSLEQQLSSRGNWSEMHRIIEASLSQINSIRQSRT